MKIGIRLTCILIALLVSFSVPLFAQAIKQEMTVFMNHWQAAYNSKDVQVLRSYYTKESVLTGPTGTVITGSDSIVNVYARDFENSDATANMTVTTDKVIATGADKITVSGSWHARGRLKDTAQSYDIKGTYTNVLIKDGKTWKISKSVLAIT